MKQFYLAGDRELGDIAAEALRSEGAKGGAALGSDMFGWACNWDKRGNIISG